MRVMLGITGASGAPYAARILRAVTDAGADVGVCASAAGRQVIALEIYGDRDMDPAGALERFIEEQIGNLRIFEPPPDDVEAGLCALGRRLLDLALRPEVLAFHRLFIAEAPRFPGLAKLFIERNRRRPLGEIIRVLAVYADRGMIEFGDPELLAEQFFILVAGASQRMALLGGREEPAQEVRRLEAAVRLFLDGCRKA